VTVEPEIQRELKCGSCAHPLDGCAFCDDPRCPVAICFRCINVALKRSILHPHPHGG